MEKLKRYATASDVEALANEMDQMVQRYGWQDLQVMPWTGVQMTVYQITREMRDYRKCTEGSKSYLISLANGLVDILNAWEAHELEPKIRVRNLKTGKVCAIREEIARELISDGYAEAV